MNADEAPEAFPDLLGRSATDTLATPQAPPVYVAPPPAPEVERRPPSTLALVLVSAAVLAADLGSKGWALARLGPSAGPQGVRRIEVIRGFCDFVFAQNPGGAWSFLRGLPDSARRPFFLTVSAAAIVFIVAFYRRLGPEHRALRVGLPLALGGALGNLADRLRFGWVVDFIDMYVRRGGVERHWPTYNVADIAIVIGVALMALGMLRGVPDAYDEELEDGEASAGA